MDADTLVQWKSQVFEYQQRMRTSQPAQQMALFDLTPTPCALRQIDPFGLKLYPLNFWRMPDRGGDVCLYFVIDNSLPLLLYVGETKRSPNQRWQGRHDCKQYVARYHELHGQHGLNRAVCIAFWWDVPVQRQARLALESEQIYKWRSPLNKECWQYWGQPFGK